MSSYIVTLHRTHETTITVEVEADTEQEAIAAAENLEKDEEDWSRPILLEEYVGAINEK